MSTTLNKKKRSILRANGVSEKEFFERLDKGWSIKAALHTSK